ncbi:MAG: hypothetical protein ACLUVY_05595 [Bacteroides uniformis]
MTRLLPPGRTVSIAEAVAYRHRERKWEPCGNEVEAIVRQYAWSDWRHPTSDTPQGVCRIGGPELCNPFARAVSIKGESD